MTAKSFSIKFTDNTYPNFAESGQGKVCAVRDISSGEWMKKPGKNDLNSKNVIWVCETNCKKCDLDPLGMNCSSGEMIRLVKTCGAKITVTVTNDDDD